MLMMSLIRLVGPRHSALHYRISALLTFEPQSPTPCSHLMTLSSVFWAPPWSESAKASQICRGSLMSPAAWCVMLLTAQMYPKIWQTELPAVASLRSVCAMCRSTSMYWAEGQHGEQAFYWRSVHKHKVTQELFCAGAGLL